MTYQTIINNASKELNLPEELIDKTYKAYWEFIRNTIKELPLKEDLSAEDFAKLKTSFNIPSIGKLYCSYDRYIGIKKKFNYSKNNDKY